MKFSEFVFHYVQLLCYKCHKINPSRGGLYIASKKRHPVYLSKHNSNRETQTILLMIPNGKGWHCLAVKNYKHY